MPDKSTAFAIMTLIRHRKAGTVLAFILGALCLGGCGSAPPAPGTADTPAGTQAQAGKKRFHRVLEDQFDLDYEVETKFSALDGKSCYSFITGSLTNRSQRTLSRQSVLDFIVTHQGGRLFRDITNPRADIPPGGSAPFTMVESPVHRKSCPSYDRIDVSLRQVFLN